MAGQNTFFGVMVFHPNAASNRSGRFAAVYKKHKDEKKEHDLGHQAWYIHTTNSVHKREVTFSKLMD